jgi:hypothetical protein
MTGNPPASLSAAWEYARAEIVNPGPALTAMLDRIGLPFVLLQREAFYLGATAAIAMLVETERSGPLPELLPQPELAAHLRACLLELREFQTGLAEHHEGARRVGAAREPEGGTHG